MTLSVGTHPNNRRAFTLVELLLVMTIVVIAAGILLPAMKSFIGGRGLSNEARQFLSLTRFGRGRAIAEGAPIELWINPNTKKYGLQAVAGYGTGKEAPLNYTVDGSVQLTVSPPTSVLTHSNMWTQVSGQMGAIMKIRFQPDGFISDTSPENIYFQQQGSEIWIAENQTRTRYEIKDGTPPNSRP